MGMEVDGDMPTYEYGCKNCGYHFEKLQRFSDAPLTECPNCGGEVRRVIHAAGVIFKGAGWYITDSRKGGNGAKATDDKEAAPAATTSTDGDGGKPAEKPAESAKAAATSED